MRQASFVAMFSSFPAFPIFAMPADLETDDDDLAYLAELQTAYPEITENLCDTGFEYADSCVSDDEWFVADRTGFSLRLAGVR